MRFRHNERLHSRQPDDRQLFSLLTMHLSCMAFALWHSPSRLQAAGNLGKMGISAALAMGNIVRSKIEEEIHKHQHPEEQDQSETDAVGGEDGEEAEEGTAGGEQSANTGGGSKSRGEGYLSDESSAASPR